MTQRCFPFAAAVALSAALLAACAAPPSVERQVEVTGGVIEGTSSGEDDRRLLVFKGVPYAAPPVDEARFRAPQAPPSWPGVRPADRFGAACWQPLPERDSPTDQLPERRSEDCLFLNVWTPAERVTDRLPVMVWIHGGGFRQGHGGFWAYDGSALARRGIVVVTFNYRLGPFGFLAHPALTAESEQASSGNYGLLDQIAVLAWVRDNIAVFGGDPERVTIFGESAGARSVHLLTVSPLAEGLFHRAIAQSGGAFGAVEPLSGAPEADAESRGLELVTELQEPNDDPLSLLRSVEASALTEAARDLSWSPNVDGHVLPDEPRALYAEGRFHRVPLILGSNRDEAIVLLSEPGPTTVADYRAWLAREYGDLADDFFSAYRADTDADALPAFLASLGDRDFGWHMDRWARAAAEQGAAVWLYRYDHTYPDSRLSALGAFHGSEIPFVFDTLDVLDQVRTEPIGWREEDRRVAELMGAYWTHLARDGSPNGPGLPDWPRFDETAQLLVLDAEPRSGEPMSEDRLTTLDAWQAGR
jgi:para-nitrobenzyl esterase